MGSEYDHIMCLMLMLISPNVSALYNIDDSLLHQIRFIQDDNLSLPVDPDEGSSSEVVTLWTANKERYECRLPRQLSVNDKLEGGSYTGPNAISLLEPLFVSQSCALRMEQYWNYELCHGRFLRQYHEERQGSTVKKSEYFLGRFDKAQFDAEDSFLNKAGLGVKPPIMKIESMNMPYYEIVMKDGTLCDLNGRPRMTRVKYVCYPSGNNEILSFKETFTCEYAVVVLSPLLCSHPHYRPLESTDHFIDCKPGNDLTPVKPLDLTKLEAESAEARKSIKYEIIYDTDTKPGVLMIELKTPSSNGESISDQIENLVQKTLGEILRKDRQNMQQVNDEISTSRPNPKSLLDPLSSPSSSRIPSPDTEMVKQFLRGKFCLFGGSGWWKYEFCYGVSVTQFHEFEDRPNIVIKLGHFDLNNHLKWIIDNPTKRPNSDISLRKHISQFYSNGDVCDITGGPRTVEVKLRCKKLESLSAVSIFLLEPKPCHYILVVESPIVCEIIELADSNGVIDSEAIEKSFTIFEKKSITDQKTTEVKIEETDIPKHIDESTDVESLNDFLNIYRKEFMSKMQSIKDEQIKVISQYIKKKEDEEETSGKEPKITEQVNDNPQNIK